MKWLKWIVIVPVGLLVLALGVLLVMGHLPGAGTSHVSTEIAATPHDVWSWIDNGDKLKQWVSWLVDVKQSQPRAQGSTQTWVMKDENNGGELMTIQGRCTEYVPDSRLAVTLAVPHMFDGSQAYRLTDLGNGKTRLDIDGNYRFTEWFANLMSPLVMQAARTKMVGDLAHLKSFAETHP
jgi:uncharacterized protein YndB with AHSA1/START domain